METNARTIVSRIDAILSETGAPKVNLIAHSKGGLEARMAASSLGYGTRIASITTVATPHRGSKTVDRLMKLPRSLFSLAAFTTGMCTLRLSFSARYSFAPRMFTRPPPVM